MKLYPLFDRVKTAPPPASAQREANTKVEKDVPDQDVPCDVLDVPEVKNDAVPDVPCDVRGVPRVMHDDVADVPRGECVRKQKQCTTHNCAMVRVVKKVKKWTKVRHGYAFRTRAYAIWKCSSSVNSYENRETSTSGGSSSNRGLISNSNVE